MGCTERACVVSDLVAGERLEFAYALGSLLTKPLLTGDFSARLTRYPAVPTSGYRKPLLITQGQQDPTVPFLSTAVLLGQLSASGTRYQFQSHHTDHQGIVEASWPQLIPFLEGLFITE